MSDYVYEAHTFVTHPKLGRQQCVKCGLLTLKNDFSKWAVEKGCNNQDHPSFDKQRRKVKVNS